MTGFFKIYKHRKGKWSILDEWTCGNARDQMLRTYRQCTAILWAIIVRFYRASATASFTTILTKYTIFLNPTYCGNMYCSWSPENIWDLNLLFGWFQHETLSQFRNYQPSTFCITAWHELEHVIAKIKRLRRVCYIVADFYESCHTTIKNLIGRL